MFPKNYWYPILDARSVKSKPQSIKRLGKNLLIWKKDSEVRVVEDRCPHRGVALSQGKYDQKSDRLTCKYHGFQYSSDGQCKVAPGLGKNVPKNFCLNTYQILNRHGFIWLWWGDLDKKTELPWFKEFENEPEYLAVSFDYPIPYLRVAESNFDGHHLPFVHGIKVGPEIIDSKVVRDGNLVDARYNLISDDRKKDFPVRVATHFPGTTLVETPALDAKHLVLICPVDSENTWFMTREHMKVFTKPVVGRLINRFVNLMIKKKIAPEDVRLQKTHQPLHSGEKSDRLVLPPDQSSAYYWQIYNEAMSVDAAKSSMPAVGDLDYAKVTVPRDVVPEISQ